MTLHTVDARTLAWEGYRCPGCGRMAYSGLMSLIARCECGAAMAECAGSMRAGFQSASVGKNEWIIPHEGAD